MEVMKIALLSDSHNNWEALQAAVTTAGDAGCDVAFFAGDLVRPQGVDVLAEFAGPVHMIIGNNEFQTDEIWATAEATNNVIYHGEVCDIERKGLRIFMHHYPGRATGKAHEDVYDLCIHGHSHTFRDDTIENTRLINPGALTRRGSSPEWAILDADTGELTRQNI